MTSSEHNALEDMRALDAQYPLLFLRNYDVETNWTTYLEFLQWLVSQGNVKLPLAVAFAQDEITLVEKYRALGLFTLGYAAGADFEPTADELALESTVMSMSRSGTGHGAIGDGTLIRKLWAFIQANPQLIQILLTFIK